MLSKSNICTASLWLPTPRPLGIPGAHKTTPDKTFALPGVVLCLTNPDIYSALSASRSPTS